MTKSFVVKFLNCESLLEENKRYDIEISANTHIIGTIIPDMNFVYDGKTFFYILREVDNEDIQICEDEIIQIRCLECL